MVVIDVRLDIGLDIGLDLTLGVGLIRRSKGGIESVAVREGGIGAGTGWEQVRRRRFAVPTRGLLVHSRRSGVVDSLGRILGWPSILTRLI